MIDRRMVMAGGVAASLIGVAAAAAPPAQDGMLGLDDGREVPVRRWQPPGKPRGFIPFSHGANSSGAKYDRLCGALAAAGFRVCAPTHADSPDHPGGGKLPREQGIPLRLADMRGLIAEGVAAGLPVVAAGHSYGALIAQMLGGAGGAPEAAVKAVIAWSPPGPLPPAITTGLWKTMARPMLVATGTADMLPVMAPTWDVHRVSHDVAPGPGVLFVGAGVDHYFGNIICRPERAELPQEMQFAVALAVTLGFVDAVLAGKSLLPLARAPQPGASWVEVRA
jgi:predicted alpha/beta-hydrolase family hydrolase